MKSVQIRSYFWSLCSCIRTVNWYEIFQNICFIFVNNDLIIALSITFTAWKVSKYGVFSWSVFSRIWTEYGEILRISPYQSKCGKIQTNKNSVFRHFSRRDFLKTSQLLFKITRRKSMISKFPISIGYFRKNITITYCICFSPSILG